MSLKIRLGIGHHLNAPVDSVRHIFKILAIQILLIIKIHSRVFLGTIDILIFLRLYTIFNFNILLYSANLYK